MKIIRMFWLRLNKAVWYFLGSLRIEALDRRMLKRFEQNQKNEFEL